MAQDYAQHTKGPTMPSRQPRTHKTLKRYLTSHTDDKAIALEVLAEIPAFLTEARFLCAQLQTRLV